MKTKDCLDCFHDQSHHGSFGCDECRCERPNVSSGSRTKVKSCEDCPFFIELPFGDNSLVCIDANTGIKSMVTRNVFERVNMCSKGYWGGVIPKGPLEARARRVGRPAAGFLQSQASVCADFEDSRPLCTSCGVEPGMHFRNQRAEHFCLRCTQIWDNARRQMRQNRENRRKLRSVATQDATGLATLVQEET